MHSHPLSIRYYTGLPRSPATRLDVVVRHNASTALSTACDDQPDISILDIGLPRMHRHALAQRLRANPGRDATALFRLSARCNGAALYDGGVNGFWNQNYN